MNLITLGINHKTAHIKIREQFSLRTEERVALINILKRSPYVIEVFLLSTCNRTEIYAHMVEGRPDILLQMLLKIKNIKDTDLYEKYFYVYFGDEAIRHLFQVSAGLNSMVVGEKQILGQMKTAVEFCREWGSLGKGFNILMNVAIRVGKKVRTETNIDYGGSSVSWAAIKTAQERLGSLSDKSVLIVGAGKMSKLAATHLANKGIGRIYVVNRSYDKAQLLARECGGMAINFWDIKAYLSKVDVCICSADAPHYIIERDMVAGALLNENSRKLLCIDISVPRNIDPEIVQVSGVTLLAVDDLDKVVEKNMEARYLAVRQAERMVEQKIQEFKNKWKKNQEITRQVCPAVS